MADVQRRRYELAGGAAASAVLILLSACLSGSPAASAPGDSAVPSTPASAAPSFVPPDLAGRIIFSRAGGTFGDDTVFTANANGTDQRQISDLGASCCPWATRDGARILFSTLAPDDRVTTTTMNFDGSDKFVIPLPNGTLNLGPGPFSPDGQQIAFEGFDDVDEPLSGIYIGNTDGTNLVQIAGRSIPGDWSPDGSRVLFFRGPDNRSSGNLYVVNIDGSGEQQLTPNGVEVQCCGNYRWSPDGSRILFADVPGKLWLINPDGTNLTQLFVDVTVSHNRRWAITPTWSPDGAQIMFGLDPDPGTRPLGYPANGLYVIEADGTGLTLVISGSDYKRGPYWVP